MLKDWSDLSLLDYFSSKRKDKLSNEAAEEIADLYKGKIEVLKTPEGISAKAKVLYTNQLRKALVRTSKELGSSPLSSKLLELVEELPKKSQAKIKSKKKEE